MPLEHLWAGWRAAYVESVAVPAVPDGTGSVFTRILGSGFPDEETHILWRGPRTFAILNAFPYTSGHLLAMPYQEIAALEDLDDTTHAELWWLVRQAVRAVKGAYRPDGVNVGANLGRGAGAGVPTHLHVHVMPRWNGDTNFMTSVAGVRVMPEDLDTSWAKLRAAWPAGEPRP